MRSYKYSKLLPSWICIFVIICGMLKKGDCWKFCGAILCSSQNFLKIVKKNKSTVTHIWNTLDVKIQDGHQSSFWIQVNCHNFWSDSNIKTRFNLLSLAWSIQKLHLNSAVRKLQDRCQSPYWMCIFVLTFDRLLLSTPCTFDCAYSF